MPPEEQEPQREEIEKAARDRAEASSRVRETAERLDQNPKLLAYARRMRERLPGDERFGDPLSTAGQAPVELVARGISSLSPERESLAQELWYGRPSGFSSRCPRQVGAGAASSTLALAIFTDLVGFSSWALRRRRRRPATGLLREVGRVVEAAVHSTGADREDGLGDSCSWPPSSTHDSAVEAKLNSSRELLAGGTRSTVARPRLRAGSPREADQRLLQQQLSSVSTSTPAARVGDTRGRPRWLPSDSAACGASIPKLFEVGPSTRRFWRKARPGTCKVARVARAH